MFISVWTILIALYLIFVPRLQNGKFAPQGAIISLEILTILFWIFASIALFLFAIEIEPVCLVADAVSPFVKRMVVSCLVSKSITIFAALSWFVHHSLSRSRLVTGY